jgi:hypothetical protein
MSKRSKRFLAILMCAAVFSSFGCTTTTHRVESPQAAPGTHGSGEYDFELVLSTMDQSKIDQKRQIWRCRVAKIAHASIMTYYNPGFAAVYLADRVKR